MDIPPSHGRLALGRASGWMTICLKSFLTGNMAPLTGLPARLRPPNDVPLLCPASVGCPRRVRSAPFQEPAVPEPLLTQGPALHHHFHCLDSAENDPIHLKNKQCNNTWGSQITEQNRCTGNQEESKLSPRRPLKSPADTSTRTSVEEKGSHWGF